MNDKEFDKWLKERWRPFNEWKGKINERISRLEVRTKLTLAKSAYLKAQAEMRAWQGAAVGQDEVGRRRARTPDGLDETAKVRRRRARGTSE